jgi:DNA-binding response OmpR family regulator
MPTAERATAHHILIAEDSPELAALFKHLLTREGYEVSIASTGLEAMELHHQFRSAGTPISLIILDWSMPVMSGLEVANHIRGAGDQVAIVFVTAYHDVVDKSIATQLNAEMWAKPVDVTAFPGNLRRVLSQQPS